MLGAEQSGFIEEMGFSNYQKIIDEAINELKESQFKKASLSPKDYINKIRCSIETDLELLIPSEYVSDVSERMNLYRRLSNIEKSSEIQKIELELKDRFGKIPEATIDLLESIKLRELAEKRFCEKIILKKEKMIITFNKNITQNILNNIIKIIQEDREQIYSIKEDDNKIKLYVNNIDSIYDGIKIIRKINI
jgi:transcription-repair coupling factor (superfamily II helicase)